MSDAVVVDGDLCVLTEDVALEEPGHEFQPFPPPIDVLPAGGVVLLVKQRSERSCGSLWDKVLTSTGCVGVIPSTHLRRLT